VTVVLTGVTGTGAVGIIYIDGWANLNDTQTPVWVDITV